MAVSRLLILAFSMIWPELQLYELEKQMVQLEGESKILKIETDNLYQYTKNLDEGWNELNALVNRVMKAKRKDTNAEDRALTLLGKKEIISFRHQTLKKVVRVSRDLQIIRPVEQANLKVRTTLPRYPLKAKSDQVFTQILPNSGAFQL